MGTHSKSVWVGVALGVLLVLPTIALTMPESLRIPIVREHGRGDPAEAALFSHWAHDQFRCYSCRPSIFPQALQGFTHDDLDNGHFCARCHDGKKAWSIDDADVECETCHREE
jgi:c(7)-type cytochrome triheme protein